MKKTDLKRLLKPIVKECIKECLYEEGTLSTIVAEVVQGLNGNIIRESEEPVQPVTPILPTRNKEVLKEQRQMLRDAIGKESYGGINVFEGIAPMRAAPSEAATSSPLGDIDPIDAGVDISGIVAVGGKKWKAFMG